MKGASMEMTSTDMTSQVEEEGHVPAADHDQEEVKKESSSQDVAVPLAHRSIREQLLSKQFLLFSIFFTVHNNRNQFTLTTARYHLAYLGDDETDNKYLTIFMLLTAVSVVGLPVMELLVKLGGYHAALQGVNILGIIYGLIILTSKSLNVQVAGFCVFAIYRFFIYAVSFSFLPTFVGESVIGKMVGVLIAIAGVASFVNIPLGRWPVQSLDGNFFWPNFIYTVMIVPCILIARFLGKDIPRESS
jgi:Na+/melibiose symporter-like transporter